MTSAFILASASPRRRELLAAAGLEFEIFPSELDESVLADEKPLSYVRRMALSKARNVAAIRQDQLILAADTVVVLDEVIMGKPINADDAYTMLAALAGKTHQVITAYCLSAAFWSDDVLEHVVTDVSFRPLSASEIKDYIDSGEPFDKAGAYAIQGRGGALTSRLHGSYTNVVGLPLAEVLDSLKEIPRRI